MRQGDKIKKEENQKKNANRKKEINEVTGRRQAGIERSRSSSRRSGGVVKDVRIM